MGTTLGSIDAIRITDNVIPPCTEIVLHAVSLQENRQEFRPTLIKKGNRFQVLKEVCSRTSILSIRILTFIYTRCGFQVLTLM